MKAPSYFCKIAVTLQVFSLLISVIHSLSFHEYTIGSAQGDIVTLESECTVLNYKNYYKPITLTFDIAGEISGLMYTNTPVNEADTNCSQLFDNCPENSLFCGGDANDAITKHFSASISFCVPEIFVYIYTKNVEDKNSVKVSTKGIDEPCTAELDSVESTCSALNLDQCQSDCSLHCGLLTCKGETKNYQACRSNQLSEADHENFCNNIAGESTTSFEDKCSSSDGDNGLGAALTVFITFLIIGVIIFIACIVFYRHKIHQSGYAPWNCPVWCPSILFPPSTGSDAQGENFAGPSNVGGNGGEKELTSGFSSSSNYRPPDFYMNDDSDDEN